ncbi:MAG TPA: polyribonucleotide nucleotidyltransferase [candidate division Zixibacteria bacterium]|nr:polyribonucleotide nucleotidyltransferase [candidate division Zixibacteria bacterium]
MGVTRVSTNIAGTDLIIETGKLAKQADGAVWVQSGGTVVLVTAVSAREQAPYQGFFPLTVEYRERAYAAGKIPGGFFKREGKPYDHEVLRARLIDRPLRPMFPDDYNYETQVIAYVVSYDQLNEPDVLGIIGASAAIAVSDIPLKSLFGAVRVAYIDGEYIVNPVVTDRERAQLDIVVAGTGEDIIMVEGGAFEVSEDILVGALGVAKEEIKKIVALQEELREKAGKPKRQYEPLLPPEGLAEAVEELAGDRIADIINHPRKQDRVALRREIKKFLAEQLAERFPNSEPFIAFEVEELEKKFMRQRIVNEGRRIDGRTPTEIRPISIEVGILPRVHGSALFTRGETQALAALTLGTKLDEQKIEDLEGESYKSFLLHYNFPPFCVGEIKRLGSPGRREIGHGHLAERALTPVIPAEEVFPYTIRIVSDILESNGSSSMATVCAGSLSLMDAGVPIKAPVAGIAMGLIKEGDKFIILSDIMGDEDHYGDMDFKVAGTAEGITAFQMDVKIPGIPLEVLKQALMQAKEGREFILSKMNEAISVPRPELSPHAPRITTVHIDPDKIGDLIGPGGKVIRGIQEETNTTISIEPDGTVFVSAHSAEDMEKALKRIEEVTHMPEVGEVYEGTVTRITTFGAFVRITPAVEGLLHISEITHRHIDRVEDYLKVGEKVRVKVIDVEKDTGRVRLSRKALIVREGGPPERRRDDRRHPKTHRR